jgi:hypothetical protein
VKVIQFCKADLAIHQAVAVRANGLAGGQFCRSPASNPPSTLRGFGRAAAEAVELSCLARLLVPCPTSLKECGKVIPQNQQRALSVAGRESCLHLCAHGIFVDTEQAGDLFHRVAAVDFDLAVVGSAQYLARFGLDWNVIAGDRRRS